MKEKDTYLDYLREMERNRRLTVFRKLIGYSFLGLFLYFLFTVSYTASPAIVILNYLALLTSVSGLVFFKMFEIPSCILEIKEKNENSGIFRLTDVHRIHILDSTARGMNIDTKSIDLASCTPYEVIQLFQLERRLPWRKIGLFYGAVYLITVLSFCTYLLLEYWETGFLRP
jgi:hypothetical protein